LRLMPMNGKRRGEFPFELYRKAGMAHVGYGRALL
jgi:hypothetical protein